MTTEIDRQNIIYTARMDGKEEGLAEGLEKGRAEEKRNTALNLKKLGVDIDIIVKATGLTKKEVESL